MIKVIAFDLDGTLLGTDHRIAPKTKEQLRIAQEAGFRLVTVTGRGEHDAKKLFAGSGIKCDWITRNGAKITLKSGEIVRTQGISDADKKWVYQQLGAYSPYAIWCGDCFQYCIGSRKKAERMFMEQIGAHSPPGVLESIRQWVQFRKMGKRTLAVSSFEELLESEPLILKIILVSRNLDFIQQLREKLSQNNSLAIAATSPFDIEITDRRAQKGLALDHLISSLGYSRREVMAFGDSLNDVSMLGMDFGATVAMGNASDEIKGIAKYVTKSNAEFGVAYAIEQVLKYQHTPANG